ncbi:MAG: TetR/AcrR family transcriptional regulator [Spirochaetia bacterium]
METDTGKRIIEGAGTLFFRQGFSKVTVEEIAEQIGITKKTIYNHFPNKTALLEEVIRSSVGTIISTIESIARDPELEFTEKVKRIVSYAFLELSGDKKNLLEDFVRYAPEMRTRDIPDFREILVDIIRHLFDEGYAKGFVKKGISREILPYMCLSIIEGMIVLYRREETDINPGRLLYYSIEISFRGILTDEGMKLITDGEAVHG